MSMRIGSSSNRSTLYRRRTNRRDRRENQSIGRRKGFSLGGGTPSRRLLRLFIALVLVLLLMQKAADPRVYRNFFAALGAPLNETRPEFFSMAPIVGQREGSSDSPDKSTPPEQTQFQLLAEPPSLEEIRQVSDAAIWDARDASVFYGLLGCAQAKWYAPYGIQPQVISYGALSGQSDWYRGKTVAIQGQVVRCEPHKAKPNEAGIERYWLVWLRPLDGSDRPVMLYASTIPDELRQLTQTGVDLKGPNVWARGVYLRRHLYQAEKGSQLAPVIVGHAELVSVGPIDRGLGEDAANRVDAERNSVRQTSSSGLIIASLIAAIVGVGGGVWLMRRTSKLEQEQRFLRRKSQAVVLENFPKLLLLVSTWASAAGVLETPSVLLADDSLASCSPSVASLVKVTIANQPTDADQLLEQNDSDDLGDPTAEQGGGGPSSATAVPSLQENGDAKVSEGVDRLLELLPGFDSRRLVALGAHLARSDASSDEGRFAVSEAAKLLWGLKRLPRKAFSDARELDFVEESSLESLTRGFQVWCGQLRGNVQRLGRIELSPEERELLEMESISLAVLVGAEPGQRIVVLMPRSPVVRTVDELAGQDVAVEGLVIRGSADTQVVFADQLRRVGRGFPDAWPSGWKILEVEGFDCREFSAVLSNMRRPLRSDESPAFYGILAAAEKIGRNPVGEQSGANVTPSKAGLDTLLRSPEKEVGAWIELDLETVRLTRVAVEKNEWRDLLGRSDYWQIDTFGTLPPGLRIELPVESKSESLTFQNRFPVSVVIAKLPEWLEREIGAELEGVGTVSGADLQINMRMLRVPIRLRGFFYRLWSYQSEYVDREGGSQIAPLLVAAELESLTPIDGSDEGVTWIGWVMGGMLFVALSVTVLVLVKAERKDAKLAAQRRKRIADHFQSPIE